MTHRILLADDSVTIRKVVELTFSDEDFAIDAVGDGAQALQRARAERPDIIISDVSMPGLNGYDLCRQLKSDPALQSVPFLFLKGTFEGFDEERARACGSDGFIIKPFESQEMIARVKEMIAGAAAAPSRPATLAPAPPAVAQPLPIQPPTPPRPRPSPAAAPAPVQRPAVVPQAPAAPVRTAAPPPPPPAPVPPPAPPAPAPVRTAAPPPPPPPPARPAPVPPPAPPLPTRPPPPLPTRPVPPPARVAPPPPPMPARPIVVSPPPPPQPSPAPGPPPFAPPAAAQTSIADFGFDLGESESDSFGEFAPPAAAHQPAAALAEPPGGGEADEDLWSEVSLRDQASDILESRPPAGSGDWPSSSFRELEEETGASPTGVTFEEVADAPIAPPAVDSEQVERLVAERIEAAVKKVLEPLVNELARSMIEAVAWEVIPDLAEAMIRAEIERVRQATRTD